MRLWRSGDDAIPAALLPLLCAWALLCHVPCTHAATPVRKIASAYVFRPVPLVETLTCMSLVYRKGYSCDSILEGASVSVAYLSSAVAHKDDLLTCDACAGLRIHTATSHRSSQITLRMSGAHPVRNYTAAVSSVVFRLANTSVDVSMMAVWQLGPGEVHTMDSGEQRWFRWYHEASAARTWSEAQAFCASQTSLGLRGYLATLTEEKEVTLVNHHRPDDRADYGWLGGTRHGDQQVWRWVTGPEGCSLPGLTNATACDFATGIENYFMACAGLGCGDGTPVSDATLPTVDAALGAGLDFMAASGSSGGLRAHAGDAHHVPVCEWGGIGEFGLEDGFFGYTLIVPIMIPTDDPCAPAGQLRQCTQDSPPVCYCQCLPPAVGVRSNAPVEQCHLDECTSSCPSCAGATSCSALGYVCVDADTDATSLWDWVCKEVERRVYTPGVPEPLFPDLSCESHVRFMVLDGAPACNCNTEVDGAYAVLYDAHEDEDLDCVACTMRLDQVKTVTISALEPERVRVLTMATVDEAPQSLRFWAELLRSVRYKGPLGSVGNMRRRVAVGFGSPVFHPSLGRFIQVLRKVKWTLAGARPSWFDWQRECSAPARDLFGMVGYLSAWGIDPVLSRRAAGEIAARDPSTDPDELLFIGATRANRRGSVPSEAEEMFGWLTGPDSCPVEFLNFMPARRFVTDLAKSAFYNGQAAFLFQRSACTARYRGSFFDPRTATAIRDESTVAVGVVNDFLATYANTGEVSGVKNQGAVGGVCQWGGVGVPCAHTMLSIYHPVDLVARDALDECGTSRMGAVCAMHGQDCFDPDHYTAGDWECRCRAPSSGSRAGDHVERCSLDECTVPYDATLCPTCMPPGACPFSMTCADTRPYVGQTSDWVCTCGLDSAVGVFGASAVATAPVCTSKTSLGAAGANIYPFQDVSCSKFEFVAGSECGCAAIVTHAVVAIAEGLDQATDVLTCPSCRALGVAAVYSVRGVRGVLTLTADMHVRLGALVTAISRVQFKALGRITADAPRKLTYSVGQGEALPEVPGYFRVFTADEPMTWHNAQRECESTANSMFGLTGYLAALTDDAKVAAVSKLLPGHVGTAGYFVGGARRGSGSARHVWSTGPEGCPPRASCFPSGVDPWQPCLGVECSTTAMPVAGLADAGGLYTHLNATQRAYGEKITTALAAGSQPLLRFVCEWGGVGALCLGERFLRGSVLVVSTDAPPTNTPVPTPVPGAPSGVPPPAGPVTDSPPPTRAPATPAPRGPSATSAPARGTAQPALPQSPTPTTVDPTPAAAATSVPETSTPAGTVPLPAPAGADGNASSTLAANRSLAPDGGAVLDLADPPANGTGLGRAAVTVGRPGLAGVIGAVSVLVGSGSGAAMRQVLALDMECMLRSVEDGIVISGGGLDPDDARYDHSEIMQRRNFLPYLSPTQITLQQRYTSGMVFAGFCFVFVAACSALAIQRYLLPSERYAMVALDQQGLLRAPSMPLIAFQYLAQGISLGTCYLFFQLPSWEAYAWGFLGILLCVMITFTLFLRLRQGVQLGKAVYIPDRDITNRHILLLIGDGEWVSRSKPGWVEKYASVLRRYRSTCPWYIVVDLTATYAMSATHVMGTSEYKDCGMMKALSAGVFAALLVADYTYAPHARSRDGWASMICIIMQCGSAISLSLGYYNLNSKTGDQTIFDAEAAAEAASNGESSTDGFELFFGLARLLAGCAEAIMLLALVMDVVAVAYVVRVRRRVRLQRSVDEVVKLEKAAAAGDGTRSGGSGGTQCADVDMVETTNTTQPLNSPGSTQQSDSNTPWDRTLERSRTNPDQPQPKLASRCLTDVGRPPHLLSDSMCDMTLSQSIAMSASQTGHDGERTSATAHSPPGAVALATPTSALPSVRSGTANTPSHSASPGSAPQLRAKKALSGLERQPSSEVCASSIRLGASTTSLLLAGANTPQAARRTPSGLDPLTPATIVPSTPTTGPRVTTIRNMLSDRKLSSVLVGVGAVSPDMSHVPPPVCRRAHSPDPQAGTPLLSGLLAEGGCTPGARSGSGERPLPVVSPTGMCDSPEKGMVPALRSLSKGHPLLPKPSVQSDGQVRAPRKSLLISAKASRKTFLGDKPCDPLTVGVPAKRQVPPVSLPPTPSKIVEL